LSDSAALRHGLLSETIADGIVLALKVVMTCAPFTATFQGSIPYCCLLVVNGFGALATMLAQEFSRRGLEIAHPHQNTTASGEDDNLYVLSGTWMPITLGSEVDGESLEKISI